MCKAGRTATYFGPIARQFLCTRSTSYSLWHKKSPLLQQTEGTFMYPSYIRGINHQSYRAHRFVVYPKSKFSIRCIRSLLRCFAGGAFLAQKYWKIQEFSLSCQRKPQNHAASSIFLSQHLLSPILYILTFFSLLMALFCIS